MSSYTRQQLEKWLKSIHVKDGATILDVGGSQNPIQPRLGSRGEDTTYKILDLEKPHEVKREPDIVCDLNYARHHIYTDKNEGIIANINSPSFDSVFCLEVAEYWWNPNMALKNIHSFLKEGGSLFISFHLTYPVHNPYEQDYLRYTERGAIKLIEQAGFKIIDIEPRMAEHHEVLNTFYTMEGMRPSKDFNRHDVVGVLISAIKT